MYLTVMCIGDMLCGCMNSQCAVLLVRCYGNHLFVGNYLFTRCIYDISVCKTKILDPKNMENDILHATFGHSVDEIQPTDSDGQPYWIFGSINVTCDN